MKEQDPSLSADAVADDVYQWDVLLGGFAPTSPLGQVRKLSTRGCTLTSDSLTSVLRARCIVLAYDNW